MELKPTTITQYDHVAAAAYLMKHTGTTALIVTSEQTGQPAGIITQADIARAITDGKDLNDVRVEAVMTTRPTGGQAAARSLSGRRRRLEFSRAGGR